MSYQSKYTGQEIDNKLDEVSNKANQADLNNLQNNITNLQDTKLNISDLLDKVYPIGSIYLAYNHTSPASLFGGTWTRISQQFLWASSADGTIGATGGIETHTHTSAAHTHTVAGHTHSTGNHVLTLAQIPSHNHNVRYEVSGYEGWPSTTSTAGQYVFNWGNSIFSNNNSAQITTNLKQNPFIQDNKGSGSAHNHGNTGSTSLTTNSTTPGATGSSSNMPPYIQVSMWRRTE